MNWVLFSKAKQVVVCVKNPGAFTTLFPVMIILIRNCDNWFPPCFPSLLSILLTVHSFYQIENFAAVARNFVCDIALSYHVLLMEKNTCSKKKSIHCTISRSSGQSDLAMAQRSLIIWPMIEEFSFPFPSGVFLLTV